MSSQHVERHTKRSVLRISGLLAAVLSLVAGIAIVATPASAAVIAITAITPNLGTTEGGQAISITGENFPGTDTGVMFSDPVSGFVAWASDVLVSGDGTSLTAISPSATAGTYTVSVVNTDTDARADLVGGYVYTCYSPDEPLTVSEISFDRGSYLGGEDVSIYGTGFACDATVHFDGEPARIDTRVGNNEIRIVTPASTSGIGSVDVVITNGPPPGSLTVPNGYTFTALSEITPYGASSVGGTNMRIYGYGFTDDTTVTVGGIAASVEGVFSPSPAHPGKWRLDIITPAIPAGDRALVVTTPGLGAETWDGAFGISDPISVTCTTNSDTTMDPSLNATVLLELDSSCTYGNFTEISSRGTSNEEPSVTWVDRYKLQYLSQAMYGWRSPVIYTAGPAQGTDVLQFTDGTHIATLRFRVGGPIPTPPAPVPEPTPSATATATTTPPPSTIPVTATAIPQVLQTPAQIVQGLTPTQVQALSARALAALPPAAFAVMSPAQIKALNPAQVSLFSAAQIQAIPAASLRAMKPRTLNALSVSQIGSLTSAQASDLRTEQINSLGATKKKIVERKIG
jgi:hypothetical protein